MPGHSRFGGYIGEELFVSCGDWKNPPTAGIGRIHPHLAARDVPSRARNACSSGCSRSGALGASYGDWKNSPMLAPRRAARPYLPYTEGGWGGQPDLLIYVYLDECSAARPPCHHTTPSPATPGHSTPSPATPSPRITSHTITSYATPHHAITPLRQYA